VVALNVGCGGRPKDRAYDLGDIRLDVVRFPNITIRADAHNLPFKTNVFSKIFCFEVLEHLDSPIKAIKEFKRVLEDRGYIIITVPNVWYWRKMLRYTLSKYSDRYVGITDHGSHKQAWEIYEFQSLLFQAELTIGEVRWLNWYHYHDKSRMKRKLGIIEPLLNIIIPTHLRYTHVLFKVIKG